MSQCQLQLTKQLHNDKIMKLSTFSSLIKTLAR